MPSLLLMTLLGCRPSALLPPPAPPALQVGAPLREATFLEGFDLVWQKNPHRLRRLLVGARGPDEHGPAQLWAWAQGGTWASGEKGTDVPSLSVSYATVASDDIVAVPARVTLSLQGRAKGPDRRDIVPEQTTTAHIPLPDGFDGAALAPWITGLDVSTLPSHEVGYTLHGLAVSLGTPTPAEAGVEVPVTVRLEAAPVPDRSQKLLEYASTISVDLVLVAARDATTARVQGAQTLRRNAAPLLSTRRGSPARLPLSADLSPDTRSAIAGLSAFSVDVAREGPSAGRYLRALTVGLRDPRLDLTRGTWTADGDLRLSNAGDLPRAMAVHGEIEATLLQLPSVAEVTRGRFSPGEGTGCVDYPEMTPRDCPPDPGIR